MSKEIEIPVPPELEPFRGDLDYFFKTMLRKLHINRHKGFAENCTAASLVDLLEAEVEELKDALKNESQFNSALEAVDVANIAFLVALKVWQISKVEYSREQKIQKIGQKGQQHVDP